MLGHAINSLKLNGLFRELSSLINDFNAAIFTGINGSKKLKQSFDLFKPSIKINTTYNRHSHTYLTSPQINVMNNAKTNGNRSPCTKIIQQVNLSIYCTKNRSQMSLQGLKYHILYLMDIFAKELLTCHSQELSLCHDFHLERKKSHTIV